jgi:hypothetical protein
MSLMHNIRNFAETQLQGVIPWSQFSFPDEVHTDRANVSIDGRGGLYRIAVTSSYAAPPLGHVQFTDHGNGHEIAGNNQDGTWHLIAEYLKKREAGDQPIETQEAIWDKQRQEEARAALNTMADVVPLPVAEILVPPVALVYYFSDPGVWYQNGPALVTRVNADGSYNLTVMPDGSEPFYRQNVGQRSDSLKNVCWVPYPNPADKIVGDGAPDLVRMYADSQDQIAELRTAVAELTDRISMLKGSAFDQRKTA